MAHQGRSVLDDYSDSELVNLASAEDKQALELLLKRCQSRTIAMVNRYVTEYADAWDISQEVLIKLYQSISTFRHTASFHTWHYRIVMNTLSSYYRESCHRIAKSAINYEDYETHSQLLDNDSPEQKQIAEQTLQVVINSFTQLPSILKETLILYEIEGMSYEDISKTLNCPIGTVRSRIARARALVAKNPF